MEVAYSRPVPASNFSSDSASFEASSATIAATAAATSASSSICAEPEPVRVEWLQHFLMTGVEETFGGRPRPRLRLGLAGSAVAPPLLLVVGAHEEFEDEFVLLLVSALLPTPSPFSRASTVNLFADVIGSSSTISVISTPGGRAAAAAARAR